MDINAPVDQGSKEATFTALSAAFKLDDRITALLLESPMENLHDFRFYFADDEDIDEFMATVWRPRSDSPPEPEEEPELAAKITRPTHQGYLAAQVSRMKQAWRATKALSLRKEDLDAVASIPSNTANHQALKRCKVLFWERYKTAFPPDAYPCNDLLSRCHRDTRDRLLTTYDIREVRTRSDQGSITQDGPTPSHGHIHCIRDHMAKLHTYLLAMAIVGSDRVHGAPAIEEFGSDPTQFANAPWDILQAHYSHAAKKFG